MARSTVDLPEPDFADQAEAFARLTLKLDVVDRVDGAGAVAEADAEIFDVDHRRAHAAQAGSRSAPAVRRRSSSKRGQAASRPRV